MDMFHRLTISSLSLCLAIAGVHPVTCLGQTKQDKWDKDIENERKKLAKEKDPADRAESLIKIADITLNFMSEAAKANDLVAMNSYVELYRQSVTDARDAMMTSGLDPYKKPRGYKAIETGVRRHLRILQDIGRTLNLEARKPVEGVAAVASKIRDEVLHALFK
jgi:hypothetical protein